MTMYRLYSSCISQKGFLRSIIYDLQRKSFEFIPNELHSIIEKIEITHKENIFFDFLLKNEFIFELPFNLKQHFPKLKLDWKSPNIINNSIIDIGENDIESIKKACFLIEQTYCHHILLLSYKEIPLQKVITILDFFNESRVKSLTLIVKNNNDYTTQKIEDLVKEYLRIKSFIIHSSKENKTIHKAYDIYGIITFTKKEYSSKDLIVSQEQFSVNTELFTESQKHHTYFNRKLYIGKNGEIKNAPECEEKYGLIQNIENIEEFKRIILTSQFQKYWYIRKESCDVCKDCEFRHMCVDNRLPSQRKDGSYYHKKECTYNPYICKWKGEEGYLTLEDTGVISNKNGFSINHKQIEEINNMLWK